MDKLNLTAALRQRLQRGQSMVEYALILVLVILALAAALAATGPAIGNVFSNTIYNLLGQTTTPRDIADADEFWLTVTWVATQTPQEIPLPTRTQPPPSLTPTDGPSPTNTPVTPTNTPTRTPTPAPSPTPVDFIHTAPWEDSADDEVFWRLDDSLFLSADDWYGRYYPNRSLSGTPDCQGYNGDISAGYQYVLNFNWGNGAGCGNNNWPAADPGNNWSATWTRQINLETARTLRFSWRSNNGMRIWILGGAYGNDPTTCFTGVTPGGTPAGSGTPVTYGDGSSNPNGCLLLNAWIDGTAYNDPTQYEIVRTIPTGLYTVRVDYFEGCCSAFASLDITEATSATNPDDSVINASFNPVAGSPDCNWGQQDGYERDADTLDWQWEEYHNGDPAMFTRCHMELRGAVDISTLSNPIFTFWEVWDLQDNDLRVSVEFTEYFDGMGDYANTAVRDAAVWIRVPLHNGSDGGNATRTNYNWTYQEIDLTDVRGDGSATLDDNFAGKRVTFRFVIEAANHGNRTRRWYVDSISIHDSTRQTFVPGTQWDLNDSSQADDFITSGRWELTNKNTHGGSGMSWEDSYEPGDPPPNVSGYTRIDRHSQAPSSDYNLYNLRAHTIEFNGWIDVDDPLGAADNEGDTGAPMLSFWLATDLDQRTGFEIQYTLDGYNVRVPNWRPVPNTGTIIPRNNNNDVENLSMRFVEVPLEEILITEAGNFPPGNRRFRLRFVITVRSDAVREDGAWIDDIYIEREGRPRYMLYPFFDNAELGTDNFLLGGTWDRTNTTAVHGSGNSFTDTPTGNYFPETDAALQIIYPFDFNNDTPGSPYAPNCNIVPSSDCVGGGVAAVDPVMTFWHRRDINSGDEVRVEWRRVSDTSWNTIWLYTASMSYRGAVNDSSTRTSIGWEHVEIDLTPIINSYNPADANLEDDDIYIRIRVIADSGSSVGDGLYLDDIRIEERVEMVHRLWPDVENRATPGGTALGNGDGQTYFDDFDFQANWEDRWYIGGTWEVVDWEQRNGVFAMHDSATDITSGYEQVTAPPDTSQSQVDNAEDTNNVLEMRTIIDLRGTDVSELPTLYFWYRYYTGDNSYLRVQIAYELNSPGNLCSGGHQQCYEHLYGWSEWEDVWSIGDWQQTNTWQREQIDLSGYAQSGATPGRRIRIRFVNDSFDSGSKRDGMYLDNITIDYRRQGQEVRVFTLPFFDGARNLQNWVTEGFWGLSPEFFRGAGGGPASFGGALWNYTYWRCDGGNGSPNCENLAPGGTSGSNRFRVGADIFLSGTPNPTPAQCASNPNIRCGIDLDIIHEFGGSGPSGGWVNSRFLGRWTLTTPLIGGGLMSPGEYTFITVSDDGVRLKYDYVGGTSATGGPNLDGWNVIDNWTDHGRTIDMGTATLASGESYVFTLEWYEKWGDATIIMTLGANSFSFTDTPKQGPGPAFPEIPSVPRSNASLILDGVLDLTGAVNPAIEYYTYYEIDGCGRFEVSNNGGFGWTQSGLGSSGFDDPNLCFTTHMPNNGDWRQRIHNLSPYVGDFLVIRFRMDRINRDNTNRTNQSPINWLVSWWVVDIRVVG